MLHNNNYDDDDDNNNNNNNIIIIIIILFSHIGLPMELPYSRKFGDNKSPQTSRTFLRILVVFRITLF